MYSCALGQAHLGAKIKQHLTDQLFSCYTEGKPNADRTWTECFAQLVGTVLSLWDAAELDAAGEDGEVLPKFINLTDASIKMVSRFLSCEQPLLTF